MPTFAATALSHMGEGAAALLADAEARPEGTAAPVAFITPAALPTATPAAAASFANAEARPEGMTAAPAPEMQKVDYSPVAA